MSNLYSILILEFVSGRCPTGVWKVPILWMVSGWCLEDVWKVFGRHQEGFRKVLGGLMEGAWKVLGIRTLTKFLSSNCLKGVLKVSERCLEGVWGLCERFLKIGWRVPGRCIEIVFWNKNFVDSKFYRYFLLDLNCTWEWSLTLAFVQLACYFDSWVSFWIGVVQDTQTE